METLWFTLTAIALYGVSDWLVQRAEAAAGRRFEYRSAYFFIVLLTLAVTSFAGLRHLLG